MVDPVAKISDYICLCATSNPEAPDILAAFAKHFGKVDGNISELSVTMHSIDSDGMDLIVDSGTPINKKSQVVRIDFDPPLRGVNDVHSRLYKMKREAKKALKNAPKITQFEVPFDIWTTASILLFLTYIKSVPQHSTSVFWWPGRILRYIFPYALIRIAEASMCLIHLGIGAYVAFLSSEHDMPWHIAIAWVGSATIFGWPVLTRLQYLIYLAAIEPLIKGHSQKQKEV